MADATWSFYVDLNDDGDFADASENISAYVMAADWQIGFSNPYDPIARDSTATLVLKNTDKRFSPESGSVFSANWTQGKKIKIESTFGVTTRTHYLGWIESIQPLPGTFGPRTCVVRCQGFFSRAQPVESFVPLQESKTADQVIAAIVGNGSVYPPGLPVRWLLGVPGRSNIGTNTYLGAATDWLAAETGRTTFNYIGDQWRDGVSVLGALRDTVGREYGRLWIDRSGIMQFVHRHHLITDTTSDESFSNDMVGLTYEYGSEVINKVTVKARPRRVGSSPEVLARLDKATKVTASSSVTLSLRYADLTNSGAKIAGRNAITPVQTTDFIATASEDGSGTDYTSSVTATIMQESATRTTLKYTNAAVVDVWIQPGAQLRGTAIRDFGEVDYVYEDTDSISTYSLFPYAYPQQMDNVADARSLAEFIGTSRNTPRGRVSSLTIAARTSSARMTSALARTVFDRITVAETQTGTNTDYFIISEKHSVRPKQYTVTWGLEPAGAYNFWVLGVSTLGVGTALAPL